MHRTHTENKSTGECTTRGRNLSLHAVNWQNQSPLICLGVGFMYRSGFFF